MDEARVRIESSPKRVRAMLNGEIVVDCDGPLLVWEIPYYPTYFFPDTAFGPDVLSRLQSSGIARALPSDRHGGALDDFHALEWSAMDHWFEEDEEVFVHARNPYHRIDVLQSSRRVTVEVGGHVIADSSAPRLLFETGLPTRYYLPKTDVRMDLLAPSMTTTGCPYKGSARYWNVVIEGEAHGDLAWGYDFPVREAEPIAGYVCFYNEHVDITVDGRAEGRPDSPFATDRFA